MKISTTLGFDGDPARYARKARISSRPGVDLIWSGEIYGFDLVSSLAYLAGQTTTLELMTGIMPDLLAAPRRSSPRRRPPSTRCRAGGSTSASAARARR